MRPFAFLLVFTISSALVACHDGTGTESVSAPASSADATKVSADTKGAKFILPASIAPKSDTQPNFGIDTSLLQQREASVVESAWANYQRVLAGKEPQCQVSSGFSDGGTLVYDCASYELVRIKTILPPQDPNGSYELSYEYGPSLNFLNGHKVERLRVIAQEELVRLETAP